MDELLKHCVLCAVEVVAVKALVHTRKVQRPDANLSDFKRVEDVHGDGIGALIGEVPTNPATEALESLAHVDRFAVVIVEGVDAPTVAPYTLAIGIEGFEEKVDFSANRNDVRRGA